MTRLYADLAPWWPLLSPPEEYAEEAEFYARVLEDECAGPLRTILELGSGGGCNASHLASRFTLTLVDVSPAMLAVSRALNPDCEHLEGDMRTVRLGRTFDAVFIHDAICYMTIEADLGRAIETAFAHCRPGGAVLLAPDYVRETFREGTHHGGRDGTDRALRYLEWAHDPDPADTTYTVDYAYLLRENGEVRVEHDRHVEGLFPRDTWLRLLAGAGFTARPVPFPLAEPGAPGEVFAGRRPG
jgi:SAM-dependent methyltransferase